MCSKFPEKYDKFGKNIREKQTEESSFRGKGDWILFKQIVKRILAGIGILHSLVQFSQYVNLFLK